MSKVTLLTYDRSRAEGLEKAGHTVLPVMLPLSEEKIKALSAMRSDVQLVECLHDEGLGLSGYLDRLPESPRTIFFGPPLSARNRTLLMERGYPEYLDYTDTRRIQAYLKTVLASRQSETCPVIAFDSDERSSSLVSGICRVLDYGFSFPGDQDDFVEMINRRETQIALFNLENSELDLRRLIMESFRGNRVSHLPMVAYRRMEEGLFIHDLTGGLNRLTRVILTPDELYGFLIDFLFRARYYPLVNRLVTNSRMDETFTGQMESLSTYFFSNEEQVFHLSDLANPDSVEVLLRTTRQIREMLIRVESLRWLRPEEQECEASSIGGLYARGTDHLFSSRL
jgi:hypothetical protein